MTKGMRLVHGVLTLAWAVMMPIALLSGLKNSLPFIVLISLWANFASHWAAWQASRVEVKQDASEALPE